jgi:LysM repeat protein
MNKRSSAARVLAVTTLVAALVIVVVVIGGGTAQNAANREQKTPATYEVQSGDTLISIAHHNGVSVARIEALNPEVDPQILIAGETLKLR